MSILTRASKGSMLSHSELDNNFSELNAGLVDRYTKSEADARIQAIIGTAPANLDTLGEISAQLASDESAVAAIVTTLATKASIAYVDQVKAKTVTLSGDVSGSGTFDANGALTLGVTIKGDAVNNKGSISGAVSLNYGDGNYVAATVAAATTLSLAGVPDSTRAYGLTLELTNGGTNVTWPGSISWVGGSAPTLKASGVNLVTLITRNGGTSWLGTSS